MDAPKGLVVEPLFIHRPFEASPLSRLESLSCSVLNAQGELSSQLPHSTLPACMFVFTFIGLLLSRDSYLLDPFYSIPIGRVQDSLGNHSTNLSCPTMRCLLACSSLLSSGCTFLENFASYEFCSISQLALVMDL